MTLPQGGCFCKLLMPLALPSTITKKLLILKELGAKFGYFALFSQNAHSTLAVSTSAFSARYQKRIPLKLLPLWAAPPPMAESDEALAPKSKRPKRLARARIFSIRNIAQGNENSKRENWLPSITLAREVKGLTLQYQRMGRPRGCRSRDWRSRNTSRPVTQD